MKTLLLALALAVPGIPLAAAPTIDPAHKFAYGANLGWMDWRGDTDQGAVIGQFVCSGFIWAANAGWINLGSGAPVNGIRYQNTSATDSGVNHDSLGNLTGYAWGANVGWITFTNRDASGGFYAGPKVDLFTGRMSGNVWGANIGWISLSNAVAIVQTLSLLTGPDSDGDGIPDPWELLKFGNLTTANVTSDFDHDGLSDLKEYLADTDPLDPASGLKITFYTAGLAGSPADITWTSQPTRWYRLLRRTDLNAGPSWADVGLGYILPDAGTTTTRHFTDSPSPRRFYQIEPTVPLGP